MPLPRLLAAANPLDVVGFRWLNPVLARGYGAGGFQKKHVAGAVDMLGVPVVASVLVTSHFFFTQIVNHFGGFLGPSSAGDFCGPIFSFIRVHLTLGERLRLRCLKI